MIQTKATGDDSAEKSGWQPIADAPKDGRTIIGAELYRWKKYKPDGQRQMKAAGRWQRYNGHGGWENSEAPEYWQHTFTNGDRSNEPTSPAVSMNQTSKHEVKP